MLALKVIYDSEKGPEIFIGNYVMHDVVFNLKPLQLNSGSMEAQNE